MSVLVRDPLIQSHPCPLPMAVSVGQLSVKYSSAFSKMHISRRRSKITATCPYKRTEVVGEDRVQRDTRPMHFP